MKRHRKPVPVKPRPKRLALGSSPFRTQIVSGPTREQRRESIARELLAVIVNRRAGATFDPSFAARDAVEAATALLDRLEGR